MPEMTSYERIKRMFEHREADHVPIVDGPWDTTIERWRREGMPADVDWRDFFGVDKVATIRVDNSPRFECKVLEETDDYRITTTDWGATVKNWKHATSTPLDLDFIVKDRARWEEAKHRMTPTRDRVDWAHLKADYPAWRQEGRWVQALLWFGFDVTHSRMVGTERLLFALIDDPEWCVDMFSRSLDLNLALLDMVWDAGYEFDCVQWPDDLGYKGHQFMSVRMYRDLLKPLHKRAADWAHAKGCKVHLHSCGDVNPFIPEFIDIGVNALNPLEVKAGMDPIRIKREYGAHLVLHGGINAVLWDDFDAIAAEIERVVPAVKESGGYIFASDHSIPSSVSLENFRRIVELAKRAGSY